jgi:hypothetical protein
MCGNAVVSGTRRRMFEGLLLMVLAAACPLAAWAINAGDDIPWETEWPAFAGLLGGDPVSADLNANSVIDSWEFALAEYLVSQPGAIGHTAALVTQFNTNHANLEAENAALAASYGNVATLAIMCGRFAEVDAVSVSNFSISLTPALYTDAPVLRGTGDPDNDAITNQQEAALSSEGYVVQATTPDRSYTLGSPVELLNAAFYAAGLKAWQGTLNNAGTTVAFFAVNPSFQTAIYVVNLGDPSSWRPLTAILPGTPSTAIAWTPDDSALLVAYARIPMDTGEVIPMSLFGYEPNDPTVTALPSDNWMFIHARTPVVADDAAVCQGGDLAFEFNLAGNDEGWVPQNSLSALTASGGRLQGSITGGDPYLVNVIEPVDAAVNSYVVIKMKTSYGGSFSFFWWNDADGQPHARSLQLEPPNQFNTYVFPADDLGDGWTGNITTIRLDPSDNLTSGTFEVDFVRFCSGSDYTGGGKNLIALPILSDGSGDFARNPVIVTNFTPSSFPGGLGIDWPNVSPDGNRVTFAAYSQSDTPGIADSGDIYVLDSLPAILAAPKIAGTNISSLAPVNLGDPNLIPVRVSDTPDNFAETPSITQDNKLVIYEEDLNNIFRNADFFNSVELGDVEIMVSQADGNGRDFRIQLPGSQAIPSLTRGGTRLLYTATVSDSLDFHLYMANLESATPIAGTVLPGNDLVTEADQSVTDTSGTAIDLPAGVIIDFPVGAPQEIQVTTPIDPVAEAELPSDAGIDAIPIVREFGPSGTTFSTPIVVTITYTDAEVEGLDEPNLEIFLYDEISGIFDIPVTTIVARDTANNTISFTVDHFSTFGLGAEIDTDGDAIGDSSDPDDDNDGVPDAQDAHPLDTDDDGLDNAVDPDDDADGSPDSFDPMPLDTDNDGQPNATDTDDDGDHRLDTVDLRPFDTDNDGQRNDVDADDDNDGFTDVEEGDADLDSDGLGNSLDQDSDGDGADDAIERSLGTDPYDLLNPTEVPLAAWPAVIGLMALGAAALRRRRV